MTTPRHRIAIRIAAIFMLAAGALSLGGAPARAIPFDDHPKLLLHLLPRTTKGACTTYSDLPDCRTAITQGQLVDFPSDSPASYLFFMGATGPLRAAALGGNDRGIATLAFGIEYNAKVVQGVDVFEWAYCSSWAFPENGWPASGGGIVISWDETTSCRRGEVAVGGYLYCAAYSPDRIKIVPRSATGVAEVVDCLSTHYGLSESDLGSVNFSADGKTPGCNPCTASCTPVVPVQPVTWGQIKSLY